MRRYIAVSFPIRRTFALFSRVTVNFRPARAWASPGVWTLTFLMILAASGTARANTATTQSDTSLRIGIILPSGCDDLSWSQAFCESLRALVKEQRGSVSLVLQENVADLKDAEDMLRNFANQNMDLIIAHGAQYTPLVNKLAPLFPHISFAYGAGDATTNPNVFVYDPQPQEGAYLMGMAAGIMTRSNVVALIAPVDVSDAVTFNRGFEEGVKTINPAAVVSVTYTGLFDDLEISRTLAQAHINAGADILSGTGQQALGALSAVCATPDVFWMGNDFDIRATAPDHILAVQVYDYSILLQQLVTLRRQGVTGGQEFPLSLSRGNVKLEWSPLVPAAVREIVDKVRADITSGAFQLNIKSLRYNSFAGSR